MRHVKDRYARTLKYYYEKRNRQQRERWAEVVERVYTGLDNGKVGDEIVDELMQIGYRIMNEDPRATENKLKENENDKTRNNQRIAK